MKLKIADLDRTVVKLNKALAEAGLADGLENPLWAYGINFARQTDGALHGEQIVSFCGIVLWSSDTDMRHTMADGYLETLETFLLREVRTLRVKITCASEIYSRPEFHKSALRIPPNEK